METKLYEISNDIKALEDLDLPADVIADTLEGLQGTFEMKAERVGKFMANLDSHISAIDAEIKRLQARKTTMINRKDSIREYLRHNMAETGINKISCPLFNITLVKGKPIAMIEDPDSIPARYKTTETVVKIDKTLLLKELKELDPDDSIPGAVLGVGKSSLRIK